VISLAPGTKVFLACRPVDLRNGFDGLAAKAQQVIGADPFSDHLFIFRGKPGDYFKGLYWDGSGMWLPPDTAPSRRHLRLDVAADVANLYRWKTPWPFCKPRTLP
jgi:hypothetical protein